MTSITGGNDGHDTLGVSLHGVAHCDSPSPATASPAVFRRWHHNGLTCHGVATYRPPCLPWPPGAIAVTKATTLPTFRSSTGRKRRTAKTVPQLPTVTATCHLPAAVEEEDINDNFTVTLPPSRRRTAVEEEEKLLLFLNIVVAEENILLSTPVVEILLDALTTALLLSRRRVSRRLNSSSSTSLLLGGVHLGPVTLSLHRPPSSRHRPDAVSSPASSMRLSTPPRCLSAP